MGWDGGDVMHALHLLMHITSVISGQRTYRRNGGGTASKLDRARAMQSRAIRGLGL